MPEVVLVLLRVALLVLLWAFVLSALRVVRSDLRAGGPRAAAARPGVEGVAAARPSRAARREQRRTEREAAGPARSIARRLVVTEGGLAGTTVQLGDAPVTLGRADDSTLVLTDDYASSRHARLRPGDGAWLLEDLGSTNGTYLGSTRVTGPTPVPLGVPIRIGRTVLELRA